MPAPHLDFGLGTGLWDTELLRTSFDFVFETDELAVASAILEDAKRVHGRGNRSCEIDLGGAWLNAAASTADCPVLWLKNAKQGIRGEWGSKEAEKVERLAKTSPWQFWRMLRPSRLASQNMRFYGVF